MTDDEFRRHVFRTLGAIQRDQRAIREELRLQRLAWAVIAGIVVLGGVAVAILVLVPGPQLAWL